MVRSAPFRKTRVISLVAAILLLASSTLGPGLVPLLQPPSLLGSAQAASVGPGGGPGTKALASKLSPMEDPASGSQNGTNASMLQSHAGSAGPGNDGSAGNGSGGSNGSAASGSQSSSSGSGSGSGGGGSTSGITTVSSSTPKTSSSSSSGSGSGSGGSGSGSSSGSSGGDPPTMRLGLGVSGLQHLARHKGFDVADSNVKYGQVWVGPWTQGNWQGFDHQVNWMVKHNITPVIMFWYWGNDIRRACFQGGCDGKTMHGWNHMTGALNWHLRHHMKGHTAIVVLEPEFNKNGLQTYEPLDKALASKAGQLHSGYGHTKVALGLGGWDPKDWKTWNRAAGASDMVGIQLMRGSTQDSAKRYRSAPTTLLHQVRHLHHLFGKPILVDDLALSTYHGHRWRRIQLHTLQGIFHEEGKLHRAGVKGIVYRSLRDDPHATTQDYYGQAQKAWGLRHGDGHPKPGWWAFYHAVQWPWSS